MIDHEPSDDAKALVGKQVIFARSYNDGSLSAYLLPRTIAEVHAVEDPDMPDHYFDAYVMESGKAGYYERTDFYTKEQILEMLEGEQE